MDKKPAGKRDMKTALMYAAVAAITIIVMVYSGSVSLNYGQQRLTSLLTGESFPLGEIVMSHETERSFNGDGYSAIVHRLDPVMAEWFRVHAEDLGGYPIPDYSRDGWGIIRWRTVGDEAPDKEVLAFALAQAPDGIREAAEKSLARGGTLHAGFTKHLSGEDGDGRLLNVDFFIVDPEQRLFFIFNHNT